GHQLHALEASSFQMPQKVPPALGVFLHTFTDSEDFAVPILAHAHGYQHGNVLHFAAPTALEPDPIEKHVHMLPLQGTIAPSLDLTVNFLVQFADGTGTDTRAPQRFGDVFYPADADACQVHLDERLFHGAFAPSVPFDNLGLERQRSQPRHLERDLAGLRAQLPLVVPGPGVEPFRGPFVTLRP